MIFVATLQADEYDDLELPADTINMRLRDGNASYIRITVPNPLEWADDILPRSDGSMHIAADGDEIIYANIQSVNLTRGSRDVLTLAGTRYRTTSSPQTLELSGVQSIHEDDGSYLVRAVLDFDVRPSDTVTLDDGSAFEVRVMQCAITHNNAWMILEGEAA